MQFDGGQKEVIDSVSRWAKSFFPFVAGENTDKGKGTPGDRLTAEAAVSTMSPRTIRPKKVRYIAAIVQLLCLIGQFFARAANILGFDTEF